MTEQRVDRGLRAEAEPFDADADAVVGAATGSHRARWTALAVGAVLVAFIGILAFGGDDTDQTNALLGQRVPRVAGPTLDGGTYDVDDARGKWVVVNFFATWCGPCVQEHPELVKLDEWGRTSGEAEVVAVVFNDPVDTVKAFFAERGGGWPVLDNPQIPIEFQVAQVPETFLVSPAGQVVQHYEGGITADEIRSVVAQAETAPASSGADTGTSTDPAGVGRS